MPEGKEPLKFPEGPQLVRQIDVYLSQVQEFTDIRKDQTDPILRKGLYELTDTFNDLREMADSVRGKIMNNQNTQEAKENFAGLKEAMDNIMSIILQYERKS
jgi:hypothetical protein